MSSPQHVELEAAKFLQKLIQESTDEPSKLARKLYVVCSAWIIVFFVVQTSVLVDSVFVLLDMSTHEIKREGEFTAISSYLKVFLYVFHLYYFMK